MPFLGEPLTQKLAEVSCRLTADSERSHREKIILLWYPPNARIPLTLNPKPQTPNPEKPRVWQLLAPNLSSREKWRLGLSGPVFWRSGALLGGSWVVISRVISSLIKAIINCN